jgi:Ran GTPase-activating protein (RanGAP) involved in mRNA processing and transport
MSPLKCLYLAFNEFNEENALDKLKDAILHSNLKELDLSYNQLGNNGAKVVASALVQVSSLERLNLTHCGIQFKGAHSLF